MIMEDLPLVAGKTVPTCTLHERRTCYQCLHSFNCDALGDYNGSVHYGIRKTKITPINNGKNAVFIPQLDSHLGLTASVKEYSTRPNDMELHEEVFMDHIEIIRPPQVAPQDEWFYYCTACELTWMSGAEGALAAATHPSHVAIRDKRTLYCWIGAQQRSNEPSCIVGVQHFGTGSKYNTEHEFSNANEALLATTLKALQTARLGIAHERQDIVAEHVATNSQKFTEQARIFDL